MDESLKKMLDYLRLQQLAKHWDSWLAQANKGNYSHMKLLKYVIEQEYNHKRDNAKTMRIARAKIPEKFVIETFPFERQPNFDKNKIINIYDSFDTWKRNATSSGLVQLVLEKPVLPLRFSYRQLTEATTDGLLRFLNWLNYSINRWQITLKLQFLKHLHRMIVFSLMNWGISKWNRFRLVFSLH